MVIEVNANSPIKDFKDFISYAKANPGKLSIGHAGNGTTNHAAILQLESPTAHREAETAKAHRG